VQNDWLGWVAHYFEKPKPPSLQQSNNMGLHFSRIWERMFGKREMRILMVGLDAAGKVCSFFLVRNCLSHTSSLFVDHYSLQIKAW
jgi:hypothetical protein